MKKICLTFLCAVLFMVSATLGAVVAEAATDMAMLYMEMEQQK